MPTPTTVVAIPFSSHLRDSGVNQREALSRMHGQVQNMVTAISTGLLALSGRLPAEVLGGRRLDRLEDLRKDLGMPPTKTCPPHWLWQLLTDGIPVQQQMVSVDAYRAAVVLAGGTLLESDNERRISFSKGDQSKEVPVVVDGDRRLVRQDHRDSLKGDIWRAARTASGTEPMDLLLALGDGGVTSLAGWIGSATEPPAALREAAPALAAELPGVVAIVFGWAQALGAGWRTLTAEALGADRDSTAVGAQVRRALQASVYEAHKVTTSWVALDAAAAAEKSARWRALEVAVHAVPALAPKIERLMKAIEDRAAKLRRADPAAIVLDLLAFDWRACLAIGTFLERGQLAYQDRGSDHPWSHPDWDGFFEAFGTDRAALAALVAVDESEDGATCIAELARHWRKARGLARWTPPERCRIHVDWSASGTRGTLATTVDPSEPVRHRGPRAAEGTRVVLASVEWLGRVHDLRFHVGLDRGLDLTEADKAWSVRYLRNARHPERATCGAAKTFDVAVDPSGGTVKLVLPVQVDVTAFADRDALKAHAIGGWYRGRPGEEPRQPDGLKTMPPAQSTVLALDIGMAPVAGWSVLHTEGKTVSLTAEGVLGVGYQTVLTHPGIVVCHPELLLVDLVRDLRAAQLVRAAIAAAQRSSPRANRSSAATQAETELLLSDAVRAAIPDVTPPMSATFPAVIAALVAALPSVAVTCAGVGGPEYLIGSVRRPGGGKPGSSLAAGVDGLIATVLAGVADEALRTVLRPLVRPLATYLLAYHRQRVCRAEMGRFTMRDHSEADMCRLRNVTAVAHGYRSEQHFHQVAAFLPKEEAMSSRLDDATQRGWAWTTQLVIADQIERVSNLGASLAGWGQRPLAFGATIGADDPRGPWVLGYGFLRERAAHLRQEVYRAVAAHIVGLAQHYRAVLAVENLTMTTSSRADAESNGLVRRFSPREWLAIILRAADLAGVPSVLVDPSWTSQESVTVDDQGQVRLPVFRATQPAGVLDAVNRRVVAARAIAWRAITGWQRRSRVTVQISEPQPDGIRYARFAQSATATGTPVWQRRMARALGVSSADGVCWAVQADGMADLTAKVPPSVTWAGRDALAFDGTRWLALSSVPAPATARRANARP